MIKVEEVKEVQEEILIIMNIKEVSCKDNYLSDKHKEVREEFIKNNPIVPMNPKQRKYMELLEDKNVSSLAVLQEHLKHISQQLRSLIGTEQVRLIRLC